MTRRLRAFADRPLDPVAARAIVVLAGVLCLGFAVVVGLGGLEIGPTTSRPWDPTTGQRSRSSSAARPAGSPVKPTMVPPGAPMRPTQDPQDRPGSPAAARARRELATHRALQLLPWRRGDLSIALVGGRGRKAILEVRALSIRAGREGYRSFLRAHRDDGRAYHPRFRTGGGRGR